MNSAVLETEESTSAYTQRCEYCLGRPINFFKCSKCRVVYYCNAEHQKEDFSRHKSLCSKIKKARSRIVVEEKKLIHEEGAEIFVEDEGLFWGMVETRPYMRARLSLIQALESMGSLQSLTEAVSETRDCLRLNRGDNMGLRESYVFNLVRINRDQEAYDAMKWWATTGNSGDYDWGDNSLPFLDLHGEDMDEECDFLRGYAGSAFHRTCMTLIKMRLFINAQ